MSVRFPAILSGFQFGDTYEPELSVSLVRAVAPARGMLKAMPRSLASATGLSDVPGSRTTSAAAQSGPVPGISVDLLLLPCFSEGSSAKIASRHDGTGHEIMVEPLKTP